MSDLKDAVVRGVESGMQKEGNSPAREAVNSLPDLLFSTSPRKSMSILGEVASGTPNASSLADDASGILDDISGQIEGRAGGVFRGSGPGGLMGMRSRKKAVDELSQSLKETAESGDASLNDLVQAVQENPGGAGAVLQLSQHAGRSGKPPAWLLPSAGAGIGAASGAALS